MVKKKLVATLIGITTIASMLAGCGSAKTTESAQAAGNEAQTTETAGADSAEKETIRWAVMTNGLDYYTALVGIEYGIYEKYGLDIELTEYAWGINTVDAIVNGTADVGNLADYAAVNRFGNTAKDTNLVMFTQLSGGGAKTGGLYVAPQYAEDLSSLDGSEGFITTVGTVTDYYNSLIIEYLGFDESKQNLLNTDSAQTGLALAQNGEASAVFASGSNETYYQNYGWVLAVPASEIGIETYSYLITTREFSADNTETLGKLLQGINESYEYVGEHIDDVAKFLEGKTGVKADDFKATWAATNLSIGFNDAGVGQLQKIEEWAYAHERFAEEYDVTQFIETEALELAFPDKVTYKK
jgi:NitT/TauT family transport system substrate-binding protein